MVFARLLILIEQRVFHGRKFMKDKLEWINFRWAIDVNYVHMEDAPILLALVKKYGRFWDGKYWYKQQSSFILRWPDWRNRYRVDLESFNRHHKKDNGTTKQLKLEVLTA